MRHLRIIKTLGYSFEYSAFTGREFIERQSAAGAARSAALRNDLTSATNAAMLARRRAAYGFRYRVGGSGHQG